MDCGGWAVNSARGHVPFQAGGKDYTLALTTNAMVRYQDAAGETLLRGLSKLQEDVADMVRLRRLIWAGLSHHGGITEDDAGNLIDEVGLMPSIILLSNASKLAFPEIAAKDDAGDSGNGQRPTKRAATT
jgi:hypothetical protein